MQPYQRSLLALLGVAGLALAQAPAPSTARVAFDVASIRPSEPLAQGQVTAGMRIDGAQVRATYLTLKDYIMSAYRMKPYQVDCPEWMTKDRYDISATVPAGVPLTQVPDMIRTLLEDRFQIKIHRDKKEFQVYALEPGKSGIKMQPTPVDPEDLKITNEKPLDISGSGSANGISMNLGRGATYVFANNKFEAKKITLPVFAQSLERFVDRPVIDMTNATATYDFTIDLTAEDYRAMLIRAGINAGAVLTPQIIRLADGATFTSVFDGLDKLGLRLESRKAPLETVIVESALKVPTDN